MKTLRLIITTLVATLAATLPARAEYAIFDASTDSIALANGTTLGTTATIEAVVVPLSTAFGSIYFEQVDGQEYKALVISQTGANGAALALPSIGSSLVATTGVALNTAHHLAYVRDGAQERLYLDGVLVISRTVTNADISDAANASFPAAIGAGRYAPQVLIDPSFIGAVDSVRVSNIARYSGSSITAQTGDMATDANTLLLLNFDPADVTGNVVADLSGNGRNGTLGTTFPGATSPTISATPTYPGTVRVAGTDLAANEKPNGGPQELINPNGTVPEWSYGTRTTVTGTSFTPFTVAQHGNDISGYTNLDGWGNTLVNAGTAPIIINNGPGPIRALNPGVMYVHSHDTEIPVVRWTAPSTGTYLISASWLDLDTYGGDGVSCSVVVKGVSIFDTSIANGGNTATTQTIFVSAGSTVDFVLGRSGNVAHDGTAFNASITPAPAITHFTSTWNSTTGNWSDITKWSTPSAPGTFPNNGSPSPTYDAVQSGGVLTVDSVEGIALQKFTSTGRATLTAANPLTLQDRLSITAPGTDVSTDFGPHNVLNGSGLINALGGMTWSALQGIHEGVSQISGVNTAVVDGRTVATDVINITGGMTINGAGVKHLNRRAMNHGDGVNPSTATWTVDRIRFSNNAVFTNKVAAVFDNAYDGVFENSGGTSFFVNEGTFTKSAGTGTTSSAITFDNKGTVNINAGSLSLNAGGKHSGIFQIADGSTLQFGGGTHEMSPGVSFTGAGVFAASGGTINGAGAFTVDRAATWSSGHTFSGTNAVTDQTIFKNTLAISGTSGAHTLTTRTIKTEGSTTWSVNSLFFNNNGIINNSGSWLATGNGAVMQGGGSFNNLDGGTFTKSAGSTTTISQAFNNQAGATVALTGGSLNMTGGGTHAGTFDMSDGQTLLFQGNHTLEAETSFTGAGTLRIAQGTTTANAAVTISSLLDLRGFGPGNAPPVLNGAGAIMVSGPSFWSSATIAGGSTANDQITFTNTLSIHDGPGGQHTLTNRTLYTQGVTTWSANAGGNGTGTFANSGVINNSGS